MPPILPSVPYTIEEDSLRYNDYDPDGDLFALAVAGYPQHGTLTYFDFDLDSDGEGDGGFIYTAFSGYAGLDEFTYLANDGVDDSEVAATVFLEVLPRVDLDVAKINHNQENGWLDDSWPDRLEDSQGAYVPMNDDDDDYDDQRKADKDQTGKIELESDLLPILLNPIDPLSEGGTYYLSATPGVRVWENEDRTGEVKLWGDPDVTHYDATYTDAAGVGRKLYVEGTAAGAAWVGLWWWNNGWTPFADLVKINVFDWTGPLNVPDHSVHKYTVVSDVGSGSFWLEPVGGTMVDEYNNQFPVGVDWMTIKWDAGPQVGKAVYQARPYYIWDLEVNVVQVLVESPDTPLVAFDPGTPQDGTAMGNVINGILRKTVKASTGGASQVFGLEWAAKVTLDGPEAGTSVDRGVTEMLVGFIQNVDYTTHRGTYNTAGIPAKSLVEGNRYLDSDEANRPYYRAPVGNWSTLAKTRTLDANDTPRTGPPLTHDFGASVDPGDDILDQIDLDMNFDLYVVAQTTDPRNQASSVYTARAKAEWEFGGSCGVEQTPTYDWITPNSFQVTAPAGWTMITDAPEMITDPESRLAEQADADFGWVIVP